MKNLLIVVLLLLFSCTKDYELLNPPPATKSYADRVELVSDTAIYAPNVWDLEGKMLSFNDYHIYGNGTVSNIDIDASVNQVLFDTAINLVNVTTAKTPFSTKWYGTNSANADNWWNIQKSINVCRDNNLECITPGKGTFFYSKTLESSIKLNGKYQQCSIKFTGDATYWDGKQTFFYTGLTGPAINFQLNKGSKLRYANFQGKWKSPIGVDSVYFKKTEAQYTDQSGLNLPDTYTGIAIDYYYDGISRSGSTGIEMTDISVGGFAKGLAFSANGITQNDDNITIDKIHFTDNLKWCIVTGQPQEKANTIDHIYSWGSVYNVFKNFGGGAYSLTHAGIAGRCIEPVQAQIGRWFSTNIRDWYCENIGRACSVSALMPFSFYDCTFDLNTYDKKRITVYSNSTDVKFTGCNFRYYDGTGGDIKVRSIAIFTECKFYINNLLLNQ